MDQRLLTDGQRVMFQENRFSDENDYSLLLRMFPHYCRTGCTMVPRLHSLTSKPVRLGKSFSYRHKLENPNEMLS